jgi:hypothetical protein
MGLLHSVIVRGIMKGEWIVIADPAASVVDVIVN